VAGAVLQWVGAGPDMRAVTATASGAGCGAARTGRALQRHRAMRLQHWEGAAHAADRALRRVATARACACASNCHTLLMLLGTTRLRFTA
jgi:hypothetical protein